jgi:Yip1-like protein
VPEATATSADSGAAAAPAPAPAHGFLQHVTGLLFSPREEFPSIVARPRFWLPLTVWLVLSVAFTAIWLQKVDAREFMRAQIAESGRADKIPPGQMEQVIDTQSGFLKPISWASAILAPAVIVLVVAGLYLFVFRFFFAGNVTFAQSLAIVAWSDFVVVLVSLPLVLAVLVMKGDWNVNPQDALQANLAMFLDKATASKVLYKLAESVDLFSAWTIWLLSTGYGVATRRTTGAAAAGVIGLWAIYVLGKVALAAIF